MHKIFCFSVMMLFACKVMAGDIYVSPKGCDKAVGSQLAPMKTIERALRVAREWRRTNDDRAKSDIHIILESGKTFQLDEPLLLRPEDSGNAQSRTIICSSGKEQAVISGGIVAKGGSSFAAPRISGSPVMTRSLWAGEKKLRRASNLAEGKMERMLDFNKDDETITIPAASLTKFGIHSITDAPQLEMVVHQRWAIAILRVKDIKIIGDKAVLSFLNPESRWEFAHPWPQPIINGERGSSSFYLTNAKQFLDEPDEWYQDNATGEIALASATDDVVIPRLNRLMTIVGTSGDKVHDIDFQNIAFEYSAWQRPASCGHVTLQGGFPIIEAYKLTEHEGLPWAKGLENQAWVSRPEAAISITNAERVNFTGCTFSHLAANALDYVNGCSQFVIKDNMFTDIGGTAIVAGSFGEGAAEQHRPYGMANDQTTYAVPETSFLTIEGNTITNVTNEDWGAVGIACGFVHDATIQRNLVSHVNYSGICIGWGWTPQNTGMRNNRILDNTVKDYACQLFDAGGIYTMSNQPNSVIHGNTISLPTDAPYATNFRAFPIYFDACTDGYTVTGNTLPTDKKFKEKYGYNTPGGAMVIEK